MSMLNNSKMMLGAALALLVLSAPLFDAFVQQELKRQLKRILKPSQATELVPIVIVPNLIQIGLHQLVSVVTMLGI